MSRPIEANHVAFRSLKIGLLTATAGFALLAGATVLSPTPETASAASADAPAVNTVTAEVFHRTVEIDGVDIFYREAGNPENPTVLLLHGFPTSSQMFRDLIPALADDYHVLAPDYPGYGASDMPPREDFEYSFANFASLIEDFTEIKGLDTYALYLMDYGAPVGYRLFAKAPEKVTGFIIQNGNAYEEGLKEFWDPIKTLWADPSDKNRDALRQLLTIEATEWQYTHGVGNVELISPDTWHTDQYLLDRPGNQEIQLDMFYDYRTNVVEYPKWQTLFREHQIPTLIVWGKNDYIFPADGAHPYKRDLENIEFHLIDTGHFALEEYGPFIAVEIKDFLAREVTGK